MYDIKSDKILSYNTLSTPLKLPCLGGYEIRKHLLILIESDQSFLTK